MKWIQKSVCNGYIVEKSMLTSLGVKLPVQRKFTNVRDAVAWDRAPTQR